MKTHNQLYYKISEQGDTLEYHVSKDREYAKNLQSINAMVSTSYDKIEDVKAKWQKEIELYEMIEA